MSDGVNVDERLAALVSLSMTLFCRMSPYRRQWSGKLEWCERLAVRRRYPRYEPADPGASWSTPCRIGRSRSPRRPPPDPEPATKAYRQDLACVIAVLGTLFPSCADQTSLKPSKADATVRVPGSLDQYRQQRRAWACSVYRTAWTDVEVRQAAEQEALERHRRATSAASSSRLVASCWCSPRSCMPPSSNRTTPPGAPTLAPLLAAPRTTICHDDRRPRPCPRHRVAQRPEAGAQQTSVRPQPKS